MILLPCAPFENRSARVSMSRRILFCLFPITLLALACTEEEEATDDYPVVEGPAPAEDLDPALDVAEYELVVGEADIELVDGQTTGMWTYNGTSPGPLLQARVGDTVRVHVTNNLDEPTTVHWHGLRIAVEMDGVVNGSIEAIQPGESFTYEFTPPEAGTFWYHPHVRSYIQVEAGLYGAFVVHEAEEDRPDVDADRVFVLDDILLDDDGAIAGHASNHPTQMHGRSGNVLLVNGEERASRVRLAPGAVERWRLVNTANARTITLRFPNLDVREIGADGGLWPQTFTRSVDEILLPVGARAELEVRLADGEDEGGLEWIILVRNNAGDIVEDATELVPVGLDADRHASSATGHTADPSEPLEPMADDLPIDHPLRFDAVQGIDGVIWTINDMAWPDAYTWEADLATVQTIELRNNAGPEHPFHLHGQLFRILSRDGEPADEPGARDTVLVHGMETVVIASDFSNPGMWMAHCHILEHAALGMMSFVDVR
jgi:FtsP/CotA-like multicopper oxidase with cupredoxin domain